MLRPLIKITFGCTASILIPWSISFADSRAVQNKIDTIPTFSFKQDDTRFADTLRSKAMTLTADEILTKYKELKALEGKEYEGALFEDMYKHDKARPALSVFVSSSMPMASLKAFSKEARKYGATLVFKGLPNNSFQELIKLVTEINDGSNNGISKEASTQLDDEAFALFNVTKVPTIVLAEEKSCKEFQLCVSNYDKVEGNVSIRTALEMFAYNGDTSELASEVLSQ